MVPPSDRLRERTWGWFSAVHIANSYAHEFPATSANQAGGTAIFTLNDTIHQVTEKTQDRLGRWTSTKIQGKQNRSLRLISAYRCVQNFYGPLSVWNQQRYLLDVSGIQDDPLDLFDQQLGLFIEQCLETGEQVILGIDVNEDIRFGKFSAKMKTLGLTEICTHKHGTNTPSTYARGSQPIDAIYVSATILDSACGYLPVTCDHRVLWIDVPVQTILGRGLPKTPIWQPQRLTLQDPRVVQKYVTTLTEFLQQRGFLKKLQKLQTEMNEIPSADQIRQYNALDFTRLQGIKLADKKCRHIKMGQVPFSPQLVTVWKKLNAWQLLLKKFKGFRVNSRYLWRTLKAAGITDISLLTVQEVEENIAESRIQYRRLKKVAPNLRSTWLEEIANARAVQGKTEIAQELRNLITREQQRQAARAIKSCMKAVSRKGLSSIEVQDQHGEWKEITDQESIEKELLKELQTRFNQAANTPCQSEPLLSELGPMGISVTSSRILKGQYVQTGEVDEWAQRLLPFLSQVIPTAQATDLTPHQYRQGWKRVKEKTSAGPSGITIPHMKAHGTSDYLSQVDCIMANLPYRYGFSPDRWQKALDVMLEKKPGIRRLDTLRAILLFEADFNQNNKRLGREMLYRAEDCNAVAIEQYGSRKNMSAIDQSLNKALTFDIWRQLRQRGALCANDAKACYDRIVHNCASLCMQRIGTRQQPIISMFDTIQKLQHHVRTIHGTSKVHFVQQGEIPIQGVGQGNGAGPQIWALVSTPVLNMLRESGLGATFVSALSRMTTTLVGFAFVDDTDLITSGPLMSLQEVLSRIQQSLTAWEGGIRATGGAIEPRKSHWYLVDFDWRDGEPKYKSAEETGGALRVRDPVGEIRCLQKLEPWQAERTLGVRLAPDGNMDFQFKWMSDTAKDWTDRLRTGNLPRHLTWLAWRTTILKTLEYPLPTTTLTRQQCDKLTSIIANVALPRCGITRTFPRDLLHAPLKAGGLNIPNLYVEQGIAHISKLIRYSQSRKHSTGVLLRHSCEALKIELGSNGPLLQNPLELLILATDTWIKATWQFAREYDIMVYDDIPDFIPHRLNDQLIIPTVGKLGFRGKDLQRINQCRKFLRVTWIGEITTADGKNIERHAVEAPFRINQKTTIHYPAQDEPPASSWKIWVQALSKLCDQGRRLKCQMGPWIREDAVSWWLETETQRLYFDPGKSKVAEYRKVPGTRTRASVSKYRFSTTVKAVPKNCIPVTAYRNRETAYVTGLGELVREPIRSFNIPNWIIEGVTFPGNIQQELSQPVAEIKAVSDGSFKDKFGTAAWMVYVNNNCIITGRCVAPGGPDDQSAYRSELTGIYGIVSTIRYLQRAFNVSGKITVGCDGLSALRQAENLCDFINPNIPHYDLIMAIRTVIAQTEWKWSWLHVKGHQDNKKPRNELDIWSRWNIDMDLQAKAFWAEARKQYIDPEITGEPWRTEIGNKKITSNLRETLREACALPRALSYWERKNRFGILGTAEIDWDALGGAMKTTPTSRQHWVSKTISGFCATGRMMQRRRERDSDACPRCGEPETVQHIWKCKFDTDELWESSMQGVRNWLTINNTHPEMIRVIIESLNRWRTEDNVPVLTHIPWLQGLIDKQKACGWQNFFEGLVLKDWRAVMENYLRKTRSKKSSKRWITALIRKLWQVAWDLWEHRNGYLHEKDNNLISEQVNKGIQEQFNLGYFELDQQTQALFLKGLAALLRKPLDVRQQWLRRVKVARSRSQTQSGFATERRMMAQWLQKKAVCA
jgi:hypothetical protein